MHSPNPALYFTYRPSGLIIDNLTLPSLPAHVRLTPGMGFVPFPFTPQGENTTATTPHKEVWLASALDSLIRPHFQDAGYEIPQNVRVSTGFPSRGGLAKAERVIGQAWSPKCSDDGCHEIIISVYLDSPYDVLATLIHEAIHVTVGVEAGHGKLFTRCMKAVGLAGKPTATHAGEDLAQTLRKWVIKMLGEYPHARLDGHEHKKQGTRMLKLECECGCKVRTTKQWIENYGPVWPCPCGGKLRHEDV